MAAPQYLLDALGELISARPRYEQAEAFYDGDVPEVFASRRMRMLFADTSYGTNFRVNYSRTPVDALLERTQVQAITGSEPSAVNLLNEVWEDSQLGLEAKTLHKMVYEYGDAYLIGWPNEELPGGVEAYAHSPLNVRVFYDPSRPREKTHAVHAWAEPYRDVSGALREMMRVNLYYPDVVEQWVSYSGTDSATTIRRFDDFGDLLPYEDPEDPGAGAVIENPFGRIPVVHFRNERPYGRPEHADAYGLQNSLNKLMTTMMVSVDFAGYPQRYVLTDSALDSGFPTDGFSPVEDDGTIDTEGSGLSVDSALEAGPGATWLLSGSNVRVGQFEVSETQNFLNAINSLIQQMANVTDIPLHFFQRSGQMPSGESFRLANLPLDSKVEDRHALLGVSWREFFDLCLVLNGMKPSDATVAWLPPSPQTDEDSWKTAQLQLDAGVPSDEVLLERGYMPEQVAEWTDSTGTGSGTAPPS